MHVTVATLLALHFTLCLAIRVPITWIDENSEVNRNNQFAFEEFEPQNLASSNKKPIPTEYFQYTAQKPKFAVDIAKEHGVKSPEDHYKAYPIKPHTGVSKPELGKHLILDKKKLFFQPYHGSGKKNKALGIVSPSSTSYEIFHPYKLEEPALKELYQDPVMEKIRSDLENSKIRLQKHENEVGQSDITKDEYLEGPEDIDRKKVPQKNVPAPYEIHHPERRPVYYRRPSVHNHREQVLNQKLRHPWRQDHIKVKPINYRPLKNNLQSLRNQHALKYDDERNEYPQIHIPEKHIVHPEGYDIYEKGKAKFVQLRNNVDESLNEAVQKSKPIENQKLELNDDEYDEDTNSRDDEDDFVPIKNYAQVRKTETTKHLPKEAAYHDADTLEEIQNAPRLREAIKSTKAQTVYSEEGYEDSAYDHAGEQKHASDHEEHKGLLKQKELSNGKFKSPTLNTEYQNEEGSEYRDQVSDGKKWKDSKKITEKETDDEEYSEKEQEHSDESETYNQKLKNDKTFEKEDEDKANDDYQTKEFKRIKRQPLNTDSIRDRNSSNNVVNSVQDVNKYEPKISHQDLKFKSEKDNLKLHTLKVHENKANSNDKYPYYYNKFREISKDSPLRYAENLKFIPNKSEGGTVFYDTREKFQCPEVEDNVDPIPEKIKKGGHPDEDEEEENEDFEDSKEHKDTSDSSALNQTPRLKGLGDKIDCFKAKYFGENPLDSPFFKEEIISIPEPVIIPSIDIYRLKQAKQQSTQKSKLNDESALYKKLQESGKNVMFPLLDKLYIRDKSSVNSKIQHNSTTQAFKQKSGINNTKTVRKRRAAPFVYEPYKIIRDSQIQDSKKTTTTNNISPLIKQLQSSRVVDKVTTNTGKDQIVKRSAGTRSYKDIGKTEREKNIKSKGSEPVYDASFVDVSVDQRRGEPRYELRSANHQHSPVQNKGSVTVEPKSNTKNKIQQEGQSHNKRKPNRRRRTTTVRPFFDVSKFLPQEETDNGDAVKGNMEIITLKPHISQLDKSEEINESKEHYTEVGADKENNHKSASMTAKAPSKKVTDISPIDKSNTESDLSIRDLPKLRLITRFKNSDKTETSIIPKRTQTPSHVYEDDDKMTVPKYREKKKKISKSTLLTDTNSYGEDDDEDLSKEEEVDALIGVKHDIKEYLPMYETQVGKKRSSSENNNSESQEVDDDYEDDDPNYDEEEDENDDDEDDDDDDDVEVDEEAEIEEDSKPEVTTTETTKRTLIKTTEAPMTTTETRSARLKVEPVVVKKKLDIHTTLPINRSSPHITEFKQDIKEVEIIKEMPSRRKKRPQKNIEALELYKDENLAKDINKLGGVEVFKEELDLINGPKHGGNYRIAEVITTDHSPSSSSLRRQSENASKGDVETSQSKTSKIIEIKNDPYSRRRSDIQRARSNRNKSSKLIELSDTTENPTSKSLHGGNFKSVHDIRRRGRNRNAKIIELVDQTNGDNHSTNKHDGNSRSYGSRGGDKHQMHGGNYRSAKLVKTDDKTGTQTDTVLKKDSSTDGRQNSAILLSSFARAVSVLTTTPTPYILDPSKRMYYYVEA